MRPIPEGFEVRHSLVVTEAMTVDFEQDDPRLGKLHPVYATYWVTKHVELVSRKIILDFLEDGEEGIGFEVAVKHIASALVGMKVELVAKHLKTEYLKARGNRIYASCEVFNELGDKVTEATTTQVVMDRGRLEHNFDTLKQRWKESK